MTLLNRCQLDDDDEVRDRATMYVNILQKQMTLDAASEESSAKNTAEMALITDGLPEGVSVRGLEDAIVAYQMLPPSDVPITLDTLPIVLGTPEHQETADDNDADAIINDGEEDTYEDENSDLSNKQNQMVNTKRRSEHREWSTVVKIFIPPPSFKPVSLSLSRSPLSEIPKQVFFNPINIFDTFTTLLHYYKYTFFIQRQFF